MMASKGASGGAKTREEEFWAMAPPSLFVCCGTKALKHARLQKRKNCSCNGMQEARGQQPHQQLQRIDCEASKERLRAFGGKKHPTSNASANRKKP